MSVDQLNYLLDGSIKHQRRVDADSQRRVLSGIDGVAQGVCKIDNRTVLDHDAFWPAGRTGRINYVSQVFRLCIRFWVGRALECYRFRIGVEANTSSGILR